MKWLCKNLSWALFSSSAVFSLPQYCSQSPSYEDFPKRTQSSPIPHSPQHSIPTLLITAQWTAQPWALLTSQAHLDFASAFSLVCRRRCEAHPVLALGPFPPLQPYPVQGMRPLLIPTLIAFSRLGCGAFWVGAGIFFMAINQKQQCRFIKKLYQATQIFTFFTFWRFKILAQKASGIEIGCVRMDSIKMANTGNSLVLFPS